MKSQTRLEQLQHRLEEAYDELWDNFVDPREPFADDGQCWLPLAANGPAGALSAMSPAGEAQLADIRAQCRQLALQNEIAINGHENRISYIIGPGHTYRATLRKPVNLSAEEGRNHLLPLPLGEGRGEGADLHLFKPRGNWKPEP